MFPRAERTLDCSALGRCRNAHVASRREIFRAFIDNIFLPRRYRYYPEVLVMDPFSLEVLFTLSSRVNPDWISALHVLRPAKRKGRFYVHTS